MVWLGRLFGLTRSWQGISSWVLALAFLAASISARFVLARWLEPVPFLTFFPAIMATTLLCGWRQGTSVLFLSAIAAWYFFMPPPQELSADPPIVVGLLGFLAVGGFDVLLITALAELIRCLEEARRVQESLFQELQHRVANNMQMIVSMLQNARRGVKDSVAVEVFDRASARIAAMAQLHRRLCNPSRETKGLEPILQDALAEVFHALKVDTKVHIRAKNLSDERITAIMLLVNEAAMNAAKHCLCSGPRYVFRSHAFAARGRQARIGHP